MIPPPTARPLLVLPLLCAISTRLCAEIPPGVEIDDGSPGAVPAHPFLEGWAPSMPVSSGGGLLIDEGNGMSFSLGSFNIVINPGTTLAGNSAALEAFNRAAAQWESLFSDPITINIDADLDSLGSSTIIGSTSNVVLQDDFDVVRGMMISDSAAEPDDGIVGSLPTQAQFTAGLPSGFSLDGNISFNKANGKALGYSNLDSLFGANDATITFNADSNFDFDNGDGVTPGLIDFESAAVHEIGHALGFSSEVDRIDTALDNGLTLSTISPRTLDLFRFENATTEDPSNPAEFTNAERFLQTGSDAIFDEVIEIGLDGAEARLSTGANTGDGRQASHWKDNALIGTLIGIMDPSLTAGVVGPITSADVRVLDLAGYDFIPEPSVGLLLLAALSLGFRRNWGRRK